MANTFPYALAFDADPDMLSRLEARYRETHRHYHTWSHVLACFDARDRLQRPPSLEVDLALLFHDAIYEPLAQDNERQSAELLERETRSWAEAASVKRAKELVLATQHGHHVSESELADVVLDADLSILGADRDTFARYEDAIRREFAVVPAPLYAQGRARVLRGFLDSPTIYRTTEGQRLWEANARINLASSLAAL
jgi:predicted metal-dependent HD superfamily phosphohydrolase